MQKVKKYPTSLPINCNKPTNNNVVAFKSNIVKRSFNFVIMDSR